MLAAESLEMKNPAEAGFFMFALIPNQACN